MACFLPFRPSLSRTLGSSMGNQCGPRSRFAASFRALQRHLGRFIPLFAAIVSALPSRLRCATTAPRISSSALQRFRYQQPFFPTPLLRRRTEAFAFASASTALGFLDPLCGFSRWNLGDIFQTPTLLGFALQSLSPPR